MVHFLSLTVTQLVLLSGPLPQETNWQWRHVQL